MRKVFKKIFDFLKSIIKYIILFLAWLFMPSKRKNTPKIEAKKEEKKEEVKKEIKETKPTTSSDDNIVLPDTQDELEPLELIDIYTPVEEDKYDDKILLPLIYKNYEKIYDFKIKKLEKHEMKIVEEYTTKQLPAIKKELPRHVIKDEKYLEYRLKPIVEKQLEKEPLIKEEDNKVYFITPKEKKLVETKNIKPKAERKKEEVTIEEQIHTEAVDKEIIINNNPQPITKERETKEIKPTKIDTSLSLKDEIINAIAIGTVILASIDKAIRTPEKNEEQQLEQPKQIKETHNIETTKEQKIEPIKEIELKQEEKTITQEQEKNIEQIKEKIYEEIKKFEEEKVTKEKQKNTEEKVINEPTTKKEIELTDKTESKEEKTPKQEEKVINEEKIQEETKEIEKDIEKIEQRIEQYERENTIKLLDYTYHVEKDIKNEISKEDIEDRNYDGVEEQINKIIDNIDNFMTLNEKKLNPKQKESLEYQKNKLEDLKQKLIEQKNIDIKNEEIALEAFITEQEINGLKKQINNIDEDKKTDYQEYNIEKPEDLTQLESKKKKDVEKKLIKKQLRKSYKVIGITSILFFPFIKNKFFFFYTKNKLIQKHLYNISEIIHNKTNNPEKIDEDKIQKGENAFNESLSLAFDNLYSADLLYQETIQKYPELEYDTEFKSYYNALRYRLVKTYQKLDRKSLFFKKNLAKYKGNALKLTKKI